MCSRVPYKRVGACLCFTLLEGLELRRWNLVHLGETPSRSLARFCGSRSFWLLNIPV